MSFRCLDQKPRPHAVFEDGRRGSRRKSLYVRVGNFRFQAFDVEAGASAVDASRTLLQPNFETGAGHFERTSGRRRIDQKTGCGCPGGGTAGGEVDRMDRRGWCSQDGGAFLPARVNGSDGARKANGWQGRWLARGEVSEGGDFKTHVPMGKCGYFSAMRPQDGRSIRTSRRG
jgi:hypothetical protein